MTKPDLMPLAEEERADLVAPLRELTPDQRDALSLCTEWRVRDVATHVVSYDELSTVSPVTTFLCGGLRPGKVNEVALSKYKSLDPDGIIDLASPQPAPERSAVRVQRAGSH